jgi:hypothetical protein
MDRTRGRRLEKSVLAETTNLESRLRALELSATNDERINQISTSERSPSQAAAGNHDRQLRQDPDDNGEGFGSEASSSFFGVRRARRLGRVIGVQDVWTNAQWPDYRLTLCRWSGPLPRSAICPPREEIAHVVDNLNESRCYICCICGSLSGGCSRTAWACGRCRQQFDLPNSLRDWPTWTGQWTNTWTRVWTVHGRTYKEQCSERKPNLPGAEAKRRAHLRADRLFADEFLPYSVYSDPANQVLMRVRDGVVTEETVDADAIYRQSNNVLSLEERKQRIAKLECVTAGKHPAADWLACIWPEWNQKTRMDGLLDPAEKQGLCYRTGRPTQLAGSDEGAEGAADYDVNSDIDLGYREADDSDDPGYVSFPADGDPLEFVLAQEERRAQKELVDSVATPGQKEYLHLLGQAENGMGDAEVADILGRDRSSVRKMRNRIVQQVQAAIEKSDDPVSAPNGRLSTI